MQQKGRTSRTCGLGQSPLSTENHSGRVTGTICDMPRPVGMSYSVRVTRTGWKEEPEQDTSEPVQLGAAKTDVGPSHMVQSLGTD